MATFCFEYVGWRRGGGENQRDVRGEEGIIT
jgi:hypothetical protein